jgi:hypothetical protein
MDFWKAILGLAHRKLFIVPLVASAIAVALSGYFLTPLRYASSATMVLVTPAFGGTLSQDPTKQTDLTNPMLNFSNTLKTASAVLIQAMNTREAAAELGAPKGGPDKLTIDDGRTNPDLIDGNGPFVYVACESRSASEAKDVVVRAQQRMRLELVDRQKLMGAPPETYLTIVDVVAPTTPKVSRSARFKIGAMAFVASVVFGFTLAYALQRRRAGRRRVADRELLPPLQYLEADSSPDHDRHDDRDPAAHEWSADHAARAETGPVATVQLVYRGHGDVEYGSTPDEQHAHDDLAADGEPQVAGDQQQAHAEAGVDPLALRSAEPEAIGALDEEPTKEGWDLYIVEYPPTQRVTADGSADDALDWTLDWSVEGLESEQGSSVVGPRRRV